MLTGIKRKQNPRNCYQINGDKNADIFIYNFI